MLFQSFCRLTNGLRSFGSVCKHGRKQLLIVNKVNTRPYSSSTKGDNCSTDQHRVIVSTSKNIYENLALEDWLYENADLEKQTILLMWQNGPAIVFGRHQNPWVECNVKEANDKEVDLARRKSGGGTVYHDEGNLNCSFIKRRALYDRKANLELVVEALKAKWDVDISLNDRNDLLLGGTYKVSGTASKLGGKKTYHHFTLLMDVNKDHLHSLLNSKMEGVKSNATKSVPMSVGNLVDREPGINFSSLVDVIGSQFLKAGDSQTNALEKVSPMDELAFPGIDKHLHEISSWQWIYGKTPPFSIQRNFKSSNSNIENSIQIDVKTAKGRVIKIDIEVFLVGDLETFAIRMLQTSLLETKLCRNEVIKVLSQLKMEWIYSNFYSLSTRQTLDWVLLCVIETVGI